MLVSHNDDDDEDGLANEKTNLSVSVAVQLALTDCYLFDLRPHFHLYRYFFSFFFSKFRNDFSFVCVFFICLFWIGLIMYHLFYLVRHGHLFDNLKRRRKSDQVSLASVNTEKKVP